MWGRNWVTGSGLVWLLAIAAVPINADASSAKVRTVSAEQVIQLSDEDDEMVVLDARGAKPHQQGHIRWSTAYAKKELNAAFLATHVPSKNTVIVFYGDRNSQLASVGAKFALQAGYTDVYWLKGGWQEWQSKGLRLDQ